MSVDTSLREKRIFGVSQACIHSYGKGNFSLDYEVSARHTKMPVHNKDSVCFCHIVVCFHVTVECRQPVQNHRPSMASLPLVAKYINDLDSI